MSARISNKMEESRASNPALTASLFVSGSNCRRLASPLSAVTILDSSQPRTT